MFGTVSRTGFGAALGLVAAAPVVAEPRTTSLALAIVDQIGYLFLIRFSFLDVLNLFLRLPVLPLTRRSPRSGPLES